jgi:L,D-transpeptidase catalytic domain
MNHAFSFALLLTILASCSTPQPTASGPREKRIGPYAQCRWQLVNGIEPFTNSRMAPGFDASFNPFLTVSRRGLTVRVIGVLSDATLQRFGNSMDEVVKAYPHLTSVRYTARHTVRGEDLNRSARWRVQNPAGEIVSTEVIELPPNAVMLIYPVSVAAPGFNTAAGNWTLLSKDRSREDDDKGAFGGFPFLKYTWQGHALHGPISGDKKSNEWGLRRGNVSHGCNRMEGEHSVELAVLLGCPTEGTSALCVNAGERVTVTEEFDYFPDPRAQSVRTGVIADYAAIYDEWVTPDVADAPRDPSSPIARNLRPDAQTVILDRTLNKAWGRAVPELSAALNGRTGAGAVRVRFYSTWDNRVTSTPGSTRQFVRGLNCTQ